MAGVDDEGTGFGRYRLGRLLGRGGFGEVYEAVDTRMGRRVALKVINAAYSQDESFRQRLFREAQTAGRLHEPHVVPVHSCGEIDGRLFIDMRLIEGTDVRALLADAGAMDPARAVDVVSQVAAALDAAHAQSIVHRDVKPANILLTDGDFAYLVDFGLANADGDTRLTQSGTAVGTLAYMAPERFSGEDAGVAGDVYALACVLFECVTGSPPFAGNAPSVINGHLSSPVPAASGRRPGVPKALDSVVAKGMAKDPRARYPSAGALAAEARDVLSRRDFHQAETVMADPVAQVDWSPPRTPRIELPPPYVDQPTTTKRRRSRRRRVVLGGLGVAVTVVVALAAWGVATDSGIRDMLSFDSHGELLPFTGLQNPWGIAVARGGDVYITDRRSGLNQDVVLKLASGADAATELPFGDVFESFGIAVDDSDNVYVTSWAPGRVMKLAAGQSAPTVLPFPDLGEPTASIAVDSAGNVYAFNDRDELLKLAPGGAAPTPVPLGPLDDPDGVAVDSVGNVFVTDGGNRLLKLAPGASSPTQVAGVEYPTAIAVDESDNVYVDSTSSTGLLKWGAGATTPVQLPFLGVFSGMAFDDAGSLYATMGSGLKEVRKFSPDDLTP
ncbi:serine/threonine-protein kinase [Mycobacterium sp. URHD0025]|uniref:serine/threonine-protein kinase n=1 Tax=Mycobacterium sp. URHD0025 TaxID=1298864 RepID=UPI00040CDA50|nr:serine/threonine-protein kinase [Mycobacterium sp. URHD0025]